MFHGLKVISCTVVQIRPFTVTSKHNCCVIQRKFCLRAKVSHEMMWRLICVFKVAMQWWWRRRNMRWLYIRIHTLSCLVVFIAIHELCYAMLIHSKWKLRMIDKVFISFLDVSSFSTKEKRGRAGGKKCEAIRFSTGKFRVCLGKNTKGICRNTQRYCAKTLVIVILFTNFDLWLRA